MKKIIMGIGLWCLCGAAIAQRIPPKDTTESITLDAIIFSANRFPDSQRNIAQPVEKIGSATVFNYQSS
ncbi:MAG: hypothetical protein ACKO66_02925, partial [Flavobacteriales bacterium]